MKHLSPAVRAQLLHQANQRAYLLTIAFLWFALFFIAGATVLFYRHAIARHFDNLRAKAERNRAHLTTSAVLQRTNQVLDSTEKAA